MQGTLTGRRRNPGQNNKTVKTIIILVSVILTVLLVITGLSVYFRTSFSKMLKQEVRELMPEHTESRVFDSEMAEGLPGPVKRWLENSGVIGAVMHNALYIEQDFYLKLKPGQKDWHEAKARQYVTTDQPGFIWTIDLRMMPLVGVKGRDRFTRGRGEMLIKLLSAVPVVNEKDNHKIDQGSLQRYLAEIVWYPWAAASPYIRWEELDDHSAVATMEYKGTSGSGTFYFDKDGKVKRFSAMRYMGSGADAVKREWVIEMDESGKINGILMPVDSRASWILDEGVWTWARIKIRSVEPYDPVLHP